MLKNNKKTKRLKKSIEIINPVKIIKKKKKRTKKQ